MVLSGSRPVRHLAAWSRTVDDPFANTGGLFVCLFVYAGPVRHHVMHIGIWPGLYDLYNLESSCFI